MKKGKDLRILFLPVFMLAFAILNGNCKSATIHTINNDLRVGLQKAEKLAEDQKYDEALVVLQPIKEIYPDEPRLVALLDTIKANGGKEIKRPEALGFNYAFRKEADAGIGERIAWYLPDRLFDALDLLTVKVGIGYNSGLGVWVTRYAQLKALGGYSYGLSIAQKRNIGIYGGGGGEVAVGPADIVGMGESRVGTNGVDSIFIAQSKMITAGDPIFMRYRDVWGIGVQAAAGVDIYAEIHPLEIVDLIAGFFLIDFLNDDLATTDRLQLSSRDWENLNKSSGQISSMTRAKYNTLLKTYPTLYSKPQ
ncbi:MAG: hypothetical protein NXI24_03855 [bacterium]|nr:hypothetical protein [bacterium]